MLLALSAGCEQRLQSLHKLRPGDWMDDLAITREAQARLAADPDLAGKIKVETVNRAVYLTGKVETNELKQRAGHIVLDIPRVIKVANNLVVQATD
ncbi:MAG TPA: BON domain-containing protein [Candidatus Acidoferrales bacterium]|nr:BON domain-containing protein [Candidatus Acidoferrales bacterium]